MVTWSSCMYCVGIIFPLQVIVLLEPTDDGYLTCYLTHQRPCLINLTCVNMLWSTNAVYRNVAQENPCVKVFNRSSSGRQFGGLERGANPDNIGSNNDGLRKITPTYVLKQTTGRKQVEQPLIRILQLVLICLRKVGR